MFRSVFDIGFNGCLSSVKLDQHHEVELEIRNTIRLPLNQYYVIPCLGIDSDHSSCNNTGNYAVAFSILFLFY